MPDREIVVRRLGPGDEDVVRRLATREPQTTLLADDRTVFVAAFDRDEPVGFAFGYVLPRRHGTARMFFVYEIEVDAPFRRRGLGKRLLTEVERLARAEGVREAFVLTEADNDAANALYASLGGERSGVVMWDFRYADG